MANWEIIKGDESGAAFSLLVGRQGIPGSHRVDGLTRKQGEALGGALMRLEEMNRHGVQREIKSALGIADS